jgi:hypothetical protein
MVPATRITRLQAREMLEREFLYYLEHQDEFVGRYDGRVITLKDHRVLGVFANRQDAIRETTKRHQRGTFLVQRVSPGTEHTTVTVVTPGVT